MEWNGALEWNRIKLEDGTSGIKWGTEHDNLCDHAASLRTLAAD